MSFLDNLIAYYKLDEASGNRADSHGSFILTDNNTVGSAAGIINNGSQHVKANDEFFSNTSIGASIGNAFTVSGWFNFPNNGSQTIWGFRPPAGNVNVIQLETNIATGIIRLVVLDTSSLTRKDYTLSGFSANTWYHLVVTWDGSNLIIYRNGAITSPTKSIDLSLTLTATTRTLRLGAETSGVGVADGKLDEFGIWTRALDASEVASLYNTGAGLSYDTFLVPEMGTTTAATNISQTSAQFNGEVASDNGATVTARGFVYSTSPSPTLASTVITASGTTGTYSATATGLTLNTTYYVRAYATNANGTTYSNEISFTTLNINTYTLQKDINGVDGETYIGSINVTGTTGTITVKFGTDGTDTVIPAGSGVVTFSGTYSGLSGLIITRSIDFDGTIDDVFYVQVPLGTTVDFSLEAVTIITAVDASVFFKRIEEKIFNSFAFYRYLDVLFKDLDGFVTVTVRNEREDDSFDISKTFSVGNPASGTVSPFQKKRISFLIKDQAVIIGFSNANIGETFSIAQFLLTGYKKPEKLFSPSKIISMS